MNIWKSLIKKISALTIAFTLLIGSLGISSAFARNDVAAGYLRPGPYAVQSVPAKGPGRPNAATQRAINELGELYGCHTCGSRVPGTKSGNWIGDHQPPSALARGQAQSYYPQCRVCSSIQGGYVSGVVRSTGIVPGGGVRIFEELR
jgi:hypothetical protein